MRPHGLGEAAASTGAAVGDLGRLLEHAPRERIGPRGAEVELQVQTAPNVYRQIHLHQGTIINPRGTTLTPGMIVDVSGTAQPDHSLNADVITTH